MGKKLLHLINNQSLKRFFQNKIKENLILILLYLLFQNLLDLILNLVLDIKNHHKNHNKSLKDLKVGIIN